MRSIQGITQVQPPRRVKSLLPVLYIDLSMGTRVDLGLGYGEGEIGATGSAGLASAYGVDCERDPPKDLPRGFI